MPKPKSQKRLDIEEKFRSLVRSNGGTVLFEMNQMDWQEFWEEHAGGKCNGISILWLRHQHTELQSKAFVHLLEVRYREMEERALEVWERAKEYVAADERARSEKFTAEEREIFSAVRSVGLTSGLAKDLVWQNDKFAKALHERMHVDGQVNPLRDKVDEVKRVRAVLRSYGMTYDASETFAGGWGHGHSNLGKFVAKSGTASMVHTGKHAMAACNTLGKPRFFDSNLGAVEFKSGSNLGSFLSAYFKIPLINQVYSGSDSGKKLAVTADRYTYETTRVFTIKDPVSLGPR